jgi:hypothetical protein
VPNTHIGIIAHTQSDASHIFKTKVRAPYDNLPPEVKAVAETKTDNSLELSLSNGSLVRVATSLRSGTYRGILVTEFGKLCARFPERAREVVTGAMPTVHDGGMFTIESTAEGRDGAFYTFCQEARNRDREGLKPAPRQFKFHFYAWWQNPLAAVKPDGVMVPAIMAKYFTSVEKLLHIRLTEAQKAWYVLEAEKLQEDMKRENPSTPDEAFEAAVVGAYYSEAMAWLRENGRITSVPWDPNHPVETAWDLGIDDTNFIVFHQKIGNEHRLIDCYQNTDEGMGHYAGILNQRGYGYREHYLPHDGEQRIQGEVVQTRKGILENLTIRPIRTVERIKDKREGVHLVRTFLRKCWLDKERCAPLIKALDAHRREWDEANGCFRERAVHDWTSHPNDAMETLARGWRAPVYTDQGRGARFAKIKCNP